MLSAIMALLSAIPGISSAVQFIVGKVFDSKVAIKTAQIGGDTTVATQLVKAAVIDGETNVSRLRVLSASRPLMLIVLGFALPWIVYEWKVVVWDNVLGLGSTPAVKGAVIDWGTTIITCLFGSGTALTLGHMYFNRPDK